MMYDCPICIKRNVNYIFVLVVIVTTNAHTSCEIFKKNSLKLLPVESAQTQKCQNIVSFSTEKKNALSINIKQNIYSYINLDFHKFLCVILESEPPGKMVPVDRMRLFEQLMVYF